MIRSVIHRVTCPFCPPARGRLSDDLTALRAVEGRVDNVCLSTGRHPAVVFDPSRATGVPCGHLADLALFLGWEQFAWRGDARPGGGIEAGWCHPAAGPSGWCRVIGRPTREGP